MREVVLTSEFKKDYKRLSRSGQRDIRQLQEVTAILANDDILEENTVTAH